MGPFSDNELIELISRGRGEDPPRDEKGLALSEEERERCKVLREVWTALGEWEVAEQRKDLWPQIEASVRRHEGHMDASEYVRRRHDALQQTWTALEEWQVPQRHRDLWSDIEEAARRAGVQAVRSASGRLWGVLGVAAAVLVAAVIGHAVGRLVRPEGAGRATPSEGARQAAVEELHLDLLAHGTPSGLVSFVLNPDTGIPEEVSP